MSQWERSGNGHSARSLISKPTFKSAKIIDENLVVIEMRRVKAFFNKPMYLGCVVLEWAKELNYRFFYNFLLEIFPDIELLYMDTGNNTGLFEYFQFYTQIFSSFFLSNRLVYHKSSMR